MTRLMFIPSPTINYLEFGPIQIRFYALFIILGIAIAVYLTERRLRRIGHPSGIAIDVAIWAVPLGMIAARIYHVATHPTDYFYSGANLLRVFYIWEGGIAIFGAVIGGLIGIWIVSRRAGLSFLTILDALAPGMLIAQGVGRIGNYFNQELYGAPTDLPWGLLIGSSNAAFPDGVPAGTAFHPLFLYELIWNVVGALLILNIGRVTSTSRVSKLGSGSALGIYLAWYGLGRAWLEMLRFDPTELLILGVKFNTLTAAAAFLVGVGITWRAVVVHRRAEEEKYHVDA